MGTFIGTDAEDNVVGSIANDTIIGGGGNDVLSGGGGGTDRLEGGLGNDIFYTADHYGDTFIERAGEGTDTMIWTTGDCYGMAENIEILRLASAGAVTGIGNAQDNSIYGNDRDNWLEGRDGDDILVGGQGDDRLDGESGVDTLYGGDGSDSYFVHDNGDAAREFAGEGVDTVHVSETDAAFASAAYVLADNVENLVWDMAHTGEFYTRTMAGNSLDNIITDNAYGATIQGMAGDDQIYGGHHDDSLQGGLGDDYLVGGAHADMLKGGAGRDVFVANAYMGVDVIEDFVIGEDKIGLLDGREVSEVIQAGGDARIVFEPDGGFGDSMLLKGINIEDLNLTVDFVVDAQPNAPAPGPRPAVPDQVLTGDAGFNFLRGDWGNDLVGGLDGDDDLFGNFGSDTLAGGAGDDNLDGERGADRMEGGVGHDVYLVRDASDTVVELAGEGMDEVRTYLDNYVLAQNVERLDLGFGQAITAAGNEGDNRVKGNELDNVLAGAGGADELRGGDGADLLQGGDGNDRLDGGLDAPGTSETGYQDIGDTLVGGAGADRFVVGFRHENGFEPSGADIVMDFTQGTDLIEAWGVLGWEDIVSVVHEDGTEDTLVVFDDMQYFDATLLLKGVSADQITAEDFIFGYNGTSFADTLVGTANNDMLDSGSGADVLAGGAGSDQMIGGAGDDRLLGETGGDLLKAGDGSDRLRAGGGEDRLIGGSGQDVLYGGRGSDELTGSGGGDTFIFAGGFGSDTITDFKDDVDTIQLNAASLGLTSTADALDRATQVGGDTVFTFSTGDVLVVENIVDKSLLSNDLEIV